jgi:hypothetical protein
MFLAVILVCVTAEAQSCQLYYNTEEVFITETECKQDLERTVELNSTQPYYSINTTCLTLPGESA